jgi:hypothetical protein
MDHSIILAIKLMLSIQAEVESELLLPQVEVLLLSKLIAVSETRLANTHQWAMY